ncbi:MAG: ATP-binding protein [Rhodothermales bacterium]
MKTFFKSFYAKISAIFLALVLILAVAVSWLSIQAAKDIELETDQKLNRSLADTMAVRFQPWVLEKIDDKMIQMEIAKFMGLNRRIEIYLTGSDGMIKSYYVQEGKKIVSQFVDKEPLDAYLAGADLPIMGDDPLDASQKRPFSVAPIEIMGESGCYLYIILGGQRYDSVAAMIKDSYIVRTASIGVGLSVLFTIILGMILFGFLSNPLRNMNAVVKAFEDGDLKQRVKTKSNDELGELGASFNQMADTIVSDMEKLQNADKLRRELIANISHDLRSPLASIQGYLETILIKQEDLSLEERTRYLTVGLKNTKRLNSLVGALFELSKLDAKQIEPHFERFSIAELVQDVVMQFKPLAEKHDVSISAELGNSPLPMVYADIALVERAISNLIDNAIRHTPAGGDVCIKPSNRDMSYVSVAVVDTGKGIPEEDVARIFDRFYRVEKSRTPSGEGGAGLGLAIAKRIFELHGSTLSVQSALNEGTTFKFMLPTSAEMLFVDGISSN